MDCIIVATDGSDGAKRAVSVAAGLARDSGAKLVIANVSGGSEFPGEVFRSMSRPQNAWLGELLASESARILNEARETAAADGARKIELVSRTGDPAQSILDLANERNADALVVGKRGLGRIQGLLIGSMSQKIISLAKRTVIVVP